MTIVIYDKIEDLRKEEYQFSVIIGSTYEYPRIALEDYKVLERENTRKRNWTTTTIYSRLGDTRLEICGCKILKREEIVIPEVIEKEIRRIVAGRTIII